MSLVSSRLSRGFTLVELLVVIALIGLLAGGIGLAISGGGDRGAALQNAQSTINSLLSGTRAQAALNQTDAALFVNVSAPSEGFLREFRIARLNGSDWVVTGDAVILPAGVALVPPTDLFNSPSEVSFEPSTGDWNSSARPRFSNALETSGSSLDLRISNTGANLPSKYRLVRRFTSRGTTLSGAGNRIVLSPVDVAPGGIGLVFRNPDFARGATVSNYGVAALVNDAAGFNN